MVQLHLCARESSGASEICQFGLLETGLDREAPIVHGEVLPAQQPLSGRSEVVGQGVAIDIDGHDGTAGGFAEAAQQFNDALVGEVVEEERGEDEVEAAGCEGKMEGVAGNARGIGGFQVQRTLVQADDAGMGIRATDDRGHVAGRGADIEEREAFVLTDEARQHAAQNEVPSEIAVDPDQVAKTTARQIRLGSIHQFSAENTPIATWHPHCVGIPVTFMIGERKRWPPVIRWGACIVVIF